MFKCHSAVKVGCAFVGAACTPAAAVRSFFVAIAFLTTALRFFFAVFLPADFVFRVRIAFFCIELRFVGISICLSMGTMWKCSSNLYLRAVQIVRLRSGQLFYQGEEPPRLPSLPKRKTAAGMASWCKGKDARLLAQLCRLFSRMEEGDLRILLFMAQKMARGEAAPKTSANSKEHFG
jgi:hypothetical protein